MANLNLTKKQAVSEIFFIAEKNPDKQLNQAEVFKGLVFPPSISSELSQTLAGVC